MKLFSFRIHFLLALCSCLCGSAQTTADTLVPKRRFSILPAPIVFYTPETRFGFGASALCFFNFKKDSVGAPRSSVSTGFAYTQNKQILSALPFNLFLKNRAYQVYGEVAYNRFFYNFYGVGNAQVPDFVERYGVEFPRLRLTLLKKIVPKVYLGPRYAFDKFRLFSMDSTGQLIKGTIPGSKGGVISGFGIVGLYDSRDNVYSASRGIWTELVVYHDDPFTGSSFKYTRIAFDFCKYFHYKNNVLALNAYSIFSDTDVPFYQMGILGGQKKMRGFYEGRYRDNNVLIFQAEYRRHLFWLLGFTIFADAGQVARRYNEFNGNNWRYTYGAGLRLTIDKAQKIKLRIDFAIGNRKMLPYFTIGEAF